MLALSPEPVSAKHSSGCRPPGKWEELWKSLMFARVGGGVLECRLEMGCSARSRTPYSPTQSFSSLHQQNSQYRFEKPHCEAWDFPWGKRNKCFLFPRRPLLAAMSSGCFGSSVFGGSGSSAFRMWPLRYLPCFLRIYTLRTFILIE